MFRFSETFAERELEEVSQEEVLDFLIKLTSGNTNFSANLQTLPLS